MPKSLRMRRSRPAGAALAALCAFALACGDDPKPASLAENEMLAAPDADTQKLLDTVVRSEELIEGLRGAMGQLAFSAANLQLPDVRSRKLFWPLELEVRDLADAPSPPDAVEAGAALAALSIDTRHWDVAEPRTARANDLALWQGLLSRVDHFENTKFKIKRGRYLPSEDGDERFETEVRFTGLAVAPDGTRSWLKTKQMLVWRLMPGKDPMRPEHWRIEAWNTVKAEEMDARELLFEEVLDFAVPDPAVREQARFNLHERLTAKRILASRAGERIELPMPLEDWLDFANDRQPGVAVVDYDRDGFDDVYVMNRLGRNKFFRNRGDGSFDEIASELGLDIDSHSAAALFADFDNDGDDDLFLGRTERRSQYFENVAGRFVERSDERFDRPLPYLVSSLSAADYDEDGLLDLYVTTYSSNRITREQLLPYLSEAVVDELLERREKHGENVFYNSAGPPNLLYHNEGGGRFSEVRDPGPLAAWRNSFQGTWSDYDADGDPDMFLSNDFAADRLYRNDGGGKFVDVSEEAGITHFGLGMGASWGDFDRDGSLDLYATNMYSTAGTRITEQLHYLNPKIAEATAGNYLYRNDGGGFRKVSEREPPGLAVQETGWSWSSQFGDVDNDGYLDLAVLNGFYSAPSEVALSGDT